MKLDSQSGYRWDSALDWFNWKVNEHRHDPRWLADCITSLVSGAKIDNDTIQEIFEKEMDANGFFSKQRKRT